MGYNHIKQEDMQKLKAKVLPLHHIPYAKGAVFTIKTPNETFEIEFRSNNHYVYLYDSQGRKLFGSFLTKFNDKLDEWFSLSS